MTTAAQKVANNPLGSYPVLVDKTIDGTEMQVFRLDVGSGTTQSRVTSSSPLPVAIFSGLVPQSYDELVLAYTGANLTSVVYKLATVTVATLTLSYSGANLIGVVKT